MWQEAVIIDTKTDRLKVKSAWTFSMVWRQLYNSGRIDEMEKVNNV